MDTVYQHHVDSVYSPWGWCQGRIGGMDEGGEPACWLDRVCPECGRLRERPGAESCENCGATGDDPRDGDAPAPR
ncbi:hypothetical protein GCM10018790_42210 [Kitasatospora xanthocidica]|nr:hypothetical protein GCM10018790_42210 [Kitasatospora xanthocidica]